VAPPLLIALACLRCDVASGLSDLEIGGAGGHAGAGGAGGQGAGGDSCGNGHPDGAEECDDANDVDLDGCSNDCQLTCPNAEWVLEDNGHCYWRPPTMLPWLEAVTMCEQSGSYLATITDALERQIAADLVGPEGAWVGGLDAGGNVWSWQNGEAWTLPLFESPPWTTTGEPNDMNGEEDCLQVYDDGLFNDLNCTWTMTALCERPLSTEPP
jgi:cysteine-rich repeat protein